MTLTLSLSANLQAIAGQKVTKVSGLKGTWVIMSLDCLVMVVAMHEKPANSQQNTADCNGV